MIKRAKMNIGEPVSSLDREVHDEKGNRNGFQMLHSKHVPIFLSVQIGHSLNSTSEVNRQMLNGARVIPPQCFVNLPQLDVDF